MNAHHGWRAATVILAVSGSAAAGSEGLEQTTGQTAIVRIWHDSIEPTGGLAESAGHRLDLRSDLLVRSADDRRTPNAVNTEIDQTSFSGYREQMDQMAALWNEEYDRLRLRVLASDHVPLAGGEAITTPEAETTVRGAGVDAAPSVPAPGAAGVLAVGIGLALARKRRG